METYVEKGAGYLQAECSSGVHNNIIYILSELMVHLECKCGKKTRLH